MTTPPLGSHGDIVSVYTRENDSLFIDSVSQFATFVSQLWHSCVNRGIPVSIVPFVPFVCHSIPCLNLLLSCLNRQIRVSIVDSGTDPKSLLKYHQNALNPFCSTFCNQYNRSATYLTRRPTYKLSKTDLPFRFCKIGLRNT